MVANGSGWIMNRLLSREIELAFDVAGCDKGYSYMLGRVGRMAISKKEIHPTAVALLCNSIQRFSRERSGGNRLVSVSHLLS
jgi:hypothetical protein